MSKIILADVGMAILAKNVHNKWERYQWLTKYKTTMTVHRVLAKSKLKDGGIWLVVSIDM